MTKCSHVGYYFKVLFGGLLNPYVIIDIESFELFYLQAQQSYAQAAAAQAEAASKAIEAPPAYGAAYPPQQVAIAGLYPSLDEYMGLSLAPEVVEQHMQVVPSQVEIVFIMFWTIESFPYENRWKYLIRIKNGKRRDQVQRGKCSKIRKLRMCLIFSFLFRVWM